MKQARIFRRFPTIIFLFTACFFVFIAENAVAQNDSAQSSDKRERGIKHYQRGEYQSAISVLQTVVKLNKKDGEAFYYLGAAQLQANEAKAAQKSFKTAAKLLPQDLRPTSGLVYAALQNNKPKEAVKYAETLISQSPNDVEAYYLLGTAHNRNSDFKNALAAANRAVSLDPKFAPAYALRAEATLSDVNLLKNSSPAELAKQFAEIAASLEIHLAADNSVQTRELREQLDDIKVFAGYFDNREKRAANLLVSPMIEPPNPNAEPLKILSQPRADYTGRAREKSISGTVVLSVLFSKTGRVRYVFVQQDLGGGLTESTVKAARGIKFTPKKIDGKFVSVIKSVEFSFSIY